MVTIARLSSLDEAYRGMDLLRQHAIPPALSQEGDHLAILVDEDFAPSAELIFQKHSILSMSGIAAGPGQQTSFYAGEEENT
jgi:hypothetical protein